MDLNPDHCYLLDFVEVSGRFDFRLLKHMAFLQVVIVHLIRALGSCSLQVAGLLHRQAKDCNRLCETNVFVLPQGIICTAR